MSDPSFLCENFSILSNVQLSWINAIECLAAIYYIGLSLVGFRNIFVIFIKQRKVASIIFPLMYFLAQTICILQAAQCFMFFSLNKRV